MFGCAVTSLAVALAAAFCGFTRCMPGIAASLAETIYQIATAVFVISAICVVFVADDVLTSRRAASRHAAIGRRAASRMSSDRA